MVTFCKFMGCLKKESYTAAEALRWKEAGFSLSDANDEREKDLTPVQATESENAGA
ncbi:hypothetical protein GCM10022277_17200 [Litoribacillus peritrichatus]|uniref:Uncharacterized protein n=1 Tax=Litoribacillus peritrichatus TaxID=718191 RepID=A0ABP7MFM7_9GAMM